MKNTLKKLGAIALVLMLMMSLSVNAFAAEDMSGKSGVIGAFTAPAQPAAKEGTVKIYKELTAFNPNSSEVFAPAISYTYAIAPEAGGNTVKDAADVQVDVKTGIAGATIQSPIAWTTADTLTTSSEGTANKQSITVDFSSVAWPGAGVYRYKITETPSTYAASSVTEGDTSHVRYMDVYVKDKAEGGYEIYGYVCFTTKANIDASDVSNVAKTEGFVKDGDTLADQYYTYDLTVTKTVVNDRAMESHDWPFTVTFTPGTNVTAANIKLKTDVSRATLGNGYAGALSSDTPTIKHNGSVKYIGIPYGTAVDVHETVDVAGTTYAVKTTQADTNVDQTITGTAQGVASNDAKVSAQTTTALAAKTVDFTNTMLIISPTGVVMRVAPYALMLIGGIVLLVISRRRKAEEA